MDSQSLFLFSLICMLSSFLIPALTNGLSHLVFRDNLSEEARSVIIMNDASLHRNLSSAQATMQKFLDLVKQENTSSFTGLRSSHRLISGIKRDSITAAAEFAVYEQIHMSNPAKVEKARSEINFILTALATFYVNQFGMTAEKAESKIKEDVFFALSELDVHGHIAYSEILVNPAIALFQMQGIPKKTS